MSTDLDVLLIDGYTRGVNMPSTSNAGQLVLVNDEGNNFIFEDAADAVGVDGTLSAALAPLLRGTGLTVTSGNVLQSRQRPRLLQIQDYFLGGNLTSGSIGSLGWNLLGSGTPAISNAAIITSLFNGGRKTLATSGSTNDHTVLCLGTTETTRIATAADITILQQVGLHSAVSTKRWFFGLLDNMGTEPASASNVLGIYYDSAVSPNYQVIARVSGSGSPTVTSSAVPTSTDQLITMLQPTAGTFQFYIGNTLVGSINSGVPTISMNLGWRLETLSGAIKSAQLGYFNMICKAPSGNVYESDTFLEV